MLSMVSASVAVRSRSACSSGSSPREGLVPFQSEDELHRNAVSRLPQLSVEVLSGEGQAAGARLPVSARRVLGLRDWIRGYPPTRTSRASPKRSNAVTFPLVFSGSGTRSRRTACRWWAWKRAIDRWLRPLVFGDFELSAKVQQARHALSPDDERTTFHPLLWDELAEARAGRAGRIRQCVVCRRAFECRRGYPEDQLSWCPCLDHG